MFQCTNSLTQNTTVPEMGQEFSAPEMFQMLTRWLHSSHAQATTDSGGLWFWSSLVQFTEIIGINLQGLKKRT